MSVFLTGFPGFLGSALTERLVARGSDVTCLVQPKYRRTAERRAREIERAHAADGEVELVGGDITEADLELGEAVESLQTDTEAVYHLAAVYDLAVSREVGMAVNVEGTKNVLDFADGCENLRRFQYVSTCYVSGRYDGTFTEDHLVEGQRFNNYYETTKYLAEVAVQERMESGLPGTIYRPAIVVGDSETGETQKYDGPYYLLRWLMRQPGVAVAPVLGDPTAYEVNVVPRDFVVDAIAELSRLDESVGEVYQLCDPNPLTVDEMLRAFGRATGKRVVRVPTPKGALKRVLSRFPELEIEPATLDYFDHPTSYACENTVAALETATDGEIQCPAFGSYVGNLVSFVREHPELTPDAMV
ncbi:SDR family oxidoreductase [Haladaptatus sp. T7]|uniref:SDR family oxidoreductase n=1 Tax=Haladaptatus sp. T7 TaxID=2029368 RepID=UPI0021A252FE|nr:SDR family oxidoreductase [Haladaptatus sp. T7]GKZ12151.1 3-beta hydroxysteroid dehydrogenase [Haladaptatus sp. T7]